MKLIARGQAWLTIQSSKEWELCHSQMPRSIQKIWEIEVGSVVSDDHIRVHTADKFAPGFQQCLFPIKRLCVCSDNVRASVQNHDVSNKRLRLSLDSDHSGNLDDGVDLGLGKDTLATSTLDIKTHNSEWGNLGPLSFRLVTDHLVVTSE